MKDNRAVIKGLCFSIIKRLDFYQGVMEPSLAQIRLDQLGLALGAHLDFNVGCALLQILSAEGIVEIYFVDLQVFVYILYEEICNALL